MLKMYANFQLYFEFQETFLRVCEVNHCFEAFGLKITALKVYGMVENCSIMFAIIVKLKTENACHWFIQMYRYLCCIHV